MPSKLTTPKWLKARVETGDNWKHLRLQENTLVGTSFGRTSALLAHLANEYGEPDDKDRRLCCYFANTGREHNGTYVFGHRLTESLPSGVTWIEYVPPAEEGARPSTFSIKTVDYSTADRAGTPFRAFLQTTANYRRTKGLGPIVPTPYMRMCTAYLKSKASEKLARQMGWETWTFWAGLRADEPDRVARIRNADLSYLTHDSPLASLGITKQDVHDFWRDQSFDLFLPEWLGNCTLCFLKDQSDLTWNMAHELTKEEVQWWIDLQNDFGQFKPDRPSYAQLATEQPVRDHIRRYLNADETPRQPEWYSDSKRFRELVIQERRIKRDGVVRIPCQCEASHLIEDETLVQIKPGQAD